LKYLKSKPGDNFTYGLRYSIRHMGTSTPRWRSSAARCDLVEILGFDRRRL